MNQPYKNNILIGIISSIAIFGVFTILVFHGFLKKPDLAIGLYLLKLQQIKILSIVFSSFRFLGKSELSVIFVFIISWIAYRICSKKTAFLIFIVFLSLIITLGWLKDYTKRQRPFKDLYEISYTRSISDQRKNSYPSGHALRSAYLLLITGYLLKHSKISRKNKTLLKHLLCGTILLIGISSVAVSAHWVSDVIASYVLVFAFYFAFVFLDDYSFHT